MFGRKLEKPYVAAVVPAAGASTRMDGLDKQFEELGGAPVIVHTLSALAESDWIDEIVVVMRAQDIPDLFTLIRAFGIPKVRSVVAGGATRQQSVANGVQAVSAHTEYIAVHDGARPLVSQQVIAQAVIDAIRYQAAAAAVPVTDTIKMADADGMIDHTPDRSRLFAVQTPQVFALACYQKALEAAQQSGQDYTDDCQMLEAIGQPVYLSKGDYENLKITTPADLFVARAVAGRRAEVL